MSTMVTPGSLPLDVLTDADACNECQTDLRPRMFICAYHEGWWRGLEAVEQASESVRSEPVESNRTIDRILWNERDKDIDEIVLHNVTVHVEQMDDRCWWIGIYDPDDPDRYWMGNFVADSRGRMKFSEQENAGIEWDRDDTHEHAANVSIVDPRPDR